MVAVVVGKNVVVVEVVVEVVVGKAVAVVELNSAINQNIYTICKDSFQTP